ncbi:MAG TPA: 1-(5-phosphoribosyl)-5-[(5-phosphoribosylamino)methylideneamino]imidazole-4-carboxamide isomerase [Rariglobus sp.]|jgi:phosphoribosylformimino-5-aminoimidazole carboxamide ribotide isomerase|nr:1-(5-phosphoribosyl)-5-[(5-phosphoribosylamino)methylideneamino]imidazole-4-carboxamide isomerase [Rariglobus sp.]
MTIYPAIDIKGGRCVRLTQGRADQETVYFENPAEVAATFKQAGSTWVHVVDLDGAFTGEPQNLAKVQAIAALGMKVQLGGGMRTREIVERALAMGVSRVVIGTRAAESDAFVGELVQAFGDKIAVGIDAKNGQVAVKGWVDTTGTGAIDLAKRVSALGVGTIIYTDIGTDGMMTGPNLPAQEAMAQAVSGRTQIIASGGVSQLADVVVLNTLSKRVQNLHGVIIGKAIYEKRFTVGEALQAAK